LANQIFIFGHGGWDVCDGGHWLDVMKKWDVLKMEIRPRKAESNGVGGPLLEKREKWRTP
jgi:hypothetical protein